MCFKRHRRRPISRKRRRCNSIIRRTIPPIQLMHRLPSQSRDRRWSRSRRWRREHRRPMSRRTSEPICRISFSSLTIPPSPSRLNHRLPPLLLQLRRMRRRQLRRSHREHRRRPRIRCMHRRHKQRRRRSVHSREKGFSQSLPRSLKRIPFDLQQLQHRKQLQADRQEMHSVSLQTE